MWKSKEKPMATKFTLRPGQGNLLTAEKKSEKSPDYRGEIILDRDYAAGSSITLAGWKKVTPKGHLISLALDTRQNEDKQWPKPVGGRDDDNSVPF
jgi:hypothetical protein